MKKTLFVTMLAAALMGGQVYAATGTAIEGYDEEHSDSRFYYGKHSDAESVSGGNVTIKADAQGDVSPEATVTGGFTNNGTASDNTVTISGGMVREIYGGESMEGAATSNTVHLTGGYAQEVLGGSTVIGDATYNTVTMTADSSAEEVYGGSTGIGDALYNTVNMSGGTVSTLTGGGVLDSGDASYNTVFMSGGEVVGVVGGMAISLLGGSGGNASNNTVYMTGGTTAMVYGGAAMNGEVSGNEIHLVGEGAFYDIYEGSMLTIQEDVYAGMLIEGGSSHDNAVNVYGTGIDIGGTIGGTQQLNFHLVDGQAGASVKPMLTLGGALDLTGVEITFYADAVDDWTSFEGKTITLAQADVAIEGLESGTEVDIKRGDQVVALGQLKLSDDNTMLSLTVQGSVPEPTTGTLGVLALAGLCMRRHRK